MAIPTKKPAASHRPAVSPASSASAAAAGAAPAPYLFDEAQLMTYQSIRKNAQTAQTAVDRFMDQIRATLPNQGRGWTARADQKGFDPPKVKAGSR